jgi:putative transposase
MARNHLCDTPERLTDRRIFLNAKVIPSLQNASAILRLVPNALRISSAKGASHKSLGQRPRLADETKQALKARFKHPMPQSLSSVIIHIIFSTKRRETWIDRDLRPRLHAYLATIGRDNGSDVYRVGGAMDHVHILATLPRTLAQANFLEEIKKHSSRWVKEINPRYGGFSWQRGYGAFSVGRDEINDLIQYVEGQEEHHRHVTFQEEYRDLLRKHGIEFDERYVWD